MSSTLKVCAVAALLACCAASVTAQAPEAGEPHTVRPMTLNQTRYRLRAGESTSVDAPRETLDFLLHAKAVRVGIVGKEGGGGGGFVVGPNVAGDKVLLVASLALRPGEYRVKLSATSGAGEERVTTMGVTIHPMQAVPLNTSQPPVILINGFQLFCPITVTSPPSAATFGNLEDQLNAAGIPVYFFDNCAYGDVSIEVLASDLGQVISTLQYSDGTPVAQVDIVAHSMGGLIARGYLAGIQTDDAFQPPPNPKVSQLVLIATPNFGSFEAANGSLLAGLGIQSAEMIPGSAFLWNLGTWNQLGDDLRGVDAIAIIGNAGSWSAPGLFSTSYSNASDGVVSLTSASLSYASLGYAAPDPARTRILPYCHTDGVPIPCSGSPIANTTEAPETGQIILSFLGGTSDWMSIGGTPSTDEYLSQNGGVYFAVETANGQAYLNDLSSVVFGSYSLLNEASAAVFYDEFITGSEKFQAESASLGQVSYGSITIPTGLYTAIRAKYSPAIFEVTPLLASVPGWVVQSGGTIAISGAGFGQACPVCQVFASGSPLPVSSWNDQAISAYLPASYSGLVVIGVQTASGSDAMNIMVAQAPVLAATPSSLQFSYTIGGTVPPAQSVQITNSGTGALASNATTTAAWLALSDSRLSTLAVSVSPAGLAAGTYTGSIQISAAGASNSPLTVAVTLTVSAAPAAPASLAVAPQALTFNYTVGGTAPAAQAVSITNAGGGILSWAASSGASWLSLSPASGTAPASLTVSVSPATLAAGTYAATAQITASGAGGSPAPVGVTLVVQALVPAFTVVLATAGQVEPLAAQSIVSAYGANLAIGTAPATSLPLPTSLGGTTVTVTDSAGVARLAPLFYVSAPQINFEIPAGTATGTATVGIQNKNGTTQNATIQIGDVSPGLFQANYTSGLAAALVLPVNSAGVQGALQPDYQLGAGNSVIPLPINLGPSAETVYLEMYGTGIRNAKSVTATVGGLNVPVQFYGPAPGYAGEDQVNIGPLPHSLSGRGNVNIILVADGQPANTVNVTIQ